MNAQKTISKVVADLQSAPPVSKTASLAAAASFANLIEQDSKEAKECLIEFAGFVSTCDDIEACRKCLVYLHDNGPMLKS